MVENDVASPSYSKQITASVQPTGLLNLIQKQKIVPHQNVPYLSKYKGLVCLTLCNIIPLITGPNFSNEEKKISSYIHVNIIMLLELVLIYVYRNLCFTLSLLGFTVFGLSRSMEMFMLFVISVLSWQAQLWLLLLGRINRQRSCQNMKWSHTIEDPRFLIHTFTCMIQTMQMLHVLSSG